jgi:hypothetical protein
MATATRAHDVRLELSPEEADVLFRLLDDSTDVGNTLVDDTDLNILVDIHNALHDVVNV